MNARTDAPMLVRMPKQLSEQLPTGRLDVALHEGAGELDALLGFAARANAKRGFLFVSKVLGKHWPVTPRRMLEVHARLASSVPAGDGPVVFIAMAETAVGLGQPRQSALLKHLLRLEPLDGPGRRPTEEVHRHPVFAFGPDPADQFAVVAPVRGPVRRDHGRTSR